VNAQPKEAGSRTTVVIPTSDEQPLYYLNWVEGNIEKVTKATNGRVGYIHIPDMGVSGLNEFVKVLLPANGKGSTHCRRSRQRRR